jgi:hypothetical protein
VSFYQASFGTSTPSDHPASHDACFEGTVFETECTFTEATFNVEVGFGGATFRRKATFDGVEVRAPANFTEATFERELSVEPSRDPGDGCGGLARGEIRRWPKFQGPETLFTRTKFKGPVAFVGVTFGGVLRLDSAVFSDNVTCEISPNDLSCWKTRFVTGGTFRIAAGRAWMDEAEFTGPSVVIPPEATDKRVSIASLRRADVGKLVLSNVDLHSCVFLDAQNLDGLRIESPDSFANAPGWQVGPTPPFLWKWTRRQVIAEERQWRSGHGPSLLRRGWGQGPLAAPPKNLPPVQRQEPGTISGIYRSLRKGREDNKDEPGAADFYYGEMEMRRLAAKAFTAEWLVLGLFWLLSGYALRASRALIGLLLTSILFAAAFHAWGFAPSGLGSPSVSWPRALTYSLGTATNLLAPPERPLTVTGDFLHIALRVIGPLLLGLAVVSLRGRIKR